MFSATMKENEGLLNGVTDLESNINDVLMRKSYKEERELEEKEQKQRAELLNDIKYLINDVKNQFAPMGEEKSDLMFSPTMRKTSKELEGEELEEKEQKQREELVNDINSLIDDVKIEVVPMNEEKSDLMISATLKENDGSFNGAPNLESNRNEVLIRKTSKELEGKELEEKEQKQREELVNDINSLIDDVKMEVVPMSEEKSDLMISATMKENDDLLNEAPNLESNINELLMRKTSKELEREELEEKEQKQREELMNDIKSLIENVKKEVVEEKSDSMLSAHLKENDGLINGVPDLETNINELLMNKTSKELEKKETEEKEQKQREELMNDIKSLIDDQT